MSKLLSENIKLMTQPLNLFNYPRAIIHIDGDCFFASCEIATNPKLRGKPVVTGMERGIVSSMSYEAKARGITRAMRLFEVKKICPEAVFLPSDYEKYSLFSMRMYNIVRRFTSAVEEYSIDECFAELTGLRRPLNMSYQQIAAKIKYTLDEELGITFSLGLAPTKSLAKIASKWKKPSGYTPIPGRDIHKFLAKLPIDKVWGIGPQTSAYLKQFGINTTLEFATKSEDWVKAKMTKPHYEIWQELRGKVVYELDKKPKHKYQSISKTKTFTPPSSARQMVFSQLSKNIENACIKARRHGLAATKFFFYLKSQDFRYYGLEVKLSRATIIPTEIIDLVDKYFKFVYNPKIEYRATGAVLLGLTDQKDYQLDLFGQVLKAEKMETVFGSLDKLSKRYGKHTLFMGSSFEAMTKATHQNDRGTKTQRSINLLPGETLRKRLAIPLLGSVI